MQINSIPEELMKTFIGLGVLSVLMFTCWTAFGQAQVDSDHSEEVLNELIAQLPKGTIKHGKDIPLFMKDAIKELARISPEKLEVETLQGAIIVITAMDKYLDFMGVTSSEQRSVIKRHFYAFTINNRWPIYINGQSDLYKTASDIERRSLDNPYVYEFVVVLWHEVIHARGQADEAIAVQEEIKILENLYDRGLVKLDCVKARWVKLAQILKGQVSRKPMQLRTSRPWPS
jgi:hypothetical protein